MQLATAPAMGQESGATPGRQQEERLRCTAERRDVAAHDAPPCAGTLAVSLRNRAFLIPNDVVDGLKIQPTLGVHWSPTEALSFSLDNQTVDNGGPGRQGPFRVNRTVGGSGGSGNFLQETAVAVDARLWRSAAGTSALRLQGSLSRGVRSYHATKIATGEVIKGNRRELVPAASLLLDRWSAKARLTLGAAVVFFPPSNALYLRVLPIDSGQRFGTATGVRLQSSYRVAPTLSLWAGGFMPASGHNSISRDSGRPVRAAAWDAGIALHMNSALDAELFLSNALGNTGALAFVSDREYRAVGTGIVFRPFARDEPSRSRSDPLAASAIPAPLSRAASVIGRSRRASVSIAAGGQGLLASVDISPVEALQLGAYLDHVAGIEDEGELGASIALRLIAQSDHVPFTLGVAVSGARTNNVLVNLLSGARDEFVRRGYTKSGFSFGDESLTEGKLYVLSGSLSVQRQLGSSAMTWVAPTVALVQRNGVQLAGISAGITGRLTRSLALVTEAGVELSHHGNTLTQDGRVRRVPWEVALIRGITWRETQTPLSIRLYATNRVGDSPFHSLRVRAGGSSTLGVGLVLPLGGPP